MQRVKSSALIVPTPARAVAAPRAAGPQMGKGGNYVVRVEIEVEQNEPCASLFSTFAPLHTNPRAAHSTVRHRPH